MSWRPASRSGHRSSARSRPRSPRRVFTPDVTLAIGRLGSVAILVFMFLVGLELDLALLRRHAAGVVRIASFSLLVPFALGSALAWTLYPSLHGETSLRTPFILFVGTAMSITAMPVLTRMLADWRMLQTTIGTIATGCAAIDDIVAWTMLGLVVSLAHGEGASGVHHPVGGGLRGRHAPRRPSGPRVVDRGARAPAGRAIWVLIVAAAAVASAVAADRIGIHAVFGAFLAGACVPRHADVLEGLEHPLHRASVVLLPAFFVLIGLKTEIALVSGHNGVDDDAGDHRLRQRRQARRQRLGGAVDRVFVARLAGDWRPAQHARHGRARGPRHRPRISASFHPRSSRCS